MMTEPTIKECIKWMADATQMKHPFDSHAITTLAILRDHARLRETNVQMMEAITAALHNLEDNDVHSAYQILVTAAKAAILTETIDGTR